MFQDPIEDVYVLEEDAEYLCFGRNGNTKTCITILKIERGDEPIVEDPTAVKNIAVQATTDGVAYNLAGQQVNNTYKGIVIQNGKKAIRK